MQKPNKITYVDVKNRFSGRHLDALDGGSF